MFTGVFSRYWTCRNLTQNRILHTASALLLNATFKPFKVWDTSSTRIWSCIWRLLSCTLSIDYDTWLIQRDWRKLQLWVAFEHVVTIRYLHGGMSQTWLHVLCIWGFEPTSANHEKACLTRNSTNNRAGCIFCKFLRSHNCRWQFVIVSPQAQRWIHRDLDHPQQRPRMM